MFEAERLALIPYRGAFDGFHAKTVAVSKTCLVRFDANKYYGESCWTSRRCSRLR